MCNFRVGQKVVCVDATKWLAGFGVETRPMAGAVYTVRSVDASLGGIRLVEIVNPAMPYTEGYCECCFSNHRFRPVAERKTDISIFKAMLNKTPAKEGAE